VIFAANITLAQSKPKFDPTSVILNQIENGIADILDRLYKLESDASKSASVEELKLEISNLKDIIAAMQNDFSAASAESASKLDDLASQVASVTEIQDKRKLELPNVKARLSEIEEIFWPSVDAERVIMNETQTSAKIFLTANLDALIDDLPQEQKCEDIGNILKGISRSYNSAFVRTVSGEIKVCTLQSRRWQVLDADEFTVGHVVKSE